MTTTTIPVGSTGLLLEGLLVNGAIRESVVQADPTDPLGFASVVSSAPAVDAYGSVARIAGTPSVSVAAMPGLQITSSIPFYVVQSSGPWAVNGAVSVTSNVTIQGTSSVNVLGTPTVNVSSMPAVTLTGTSSVNVVSTAVHTVTVQGTSSVNVLNALTTTSVNVLNTLTANVTNVPLVTVQGTSSVSVLNQLTTTSVNVLGTVSANITSSIPFYVSQSSAPWVVNISTMPAASGTTMVNVVSTVAQNVSVVANSITSSIPFWVAQSSAPWDMRGAVNVSSHTAITSTWPLSTTMVNIVSSIPMSVQYLDGVSTTNATGNLMMYTSGNSSGIMEAVSSSQPLPVWITSTMATVSTQVVSSVPISVVQSSAPWTFNGGINVSSQSAVSSSFPIGTTSTQVVSSIPYYVAQSSAPWVMVQTASTAGGMNSSTYALLANLNTTVVKGTAGMIYGIIGTNIGSSNVFVRMYNQSTAALTIASTGVPRIIFGIPISSSPQMMSDIGVPFSNGITFITQQNGPTVSSSVPPTASTATITIFYQ